MPLRTPSANPGCPVTVAGNNVTFAPWDLDWELYGECPVDSTWFVYDFTVGAAQAVTAKAGTEGGGFTLTVVNAAGWATGDLCLLLPNTFNAITTHATIAALQVAAAAYDTTLLGYAAANRPRFYEGYAQGTKPQHIYGHLSRQRNHIMGATTIIGDQSLNVAQVLWRNFVVIPTSGAANCVSYQDNGVGKTGGGIRGRRIKTENAASSSVGFYNISSGNGKIKWEFCSALAGYGFYTDSGTIECYHCVALGGVSAGFYNGNKASTYTNCVAAGTAGFTTTAGATYTKCASTDATGSEAALDNMNPNGFKFWGWSGLNGYANMDCRVLSTSSLLGVGQAVAGLTTDIDGNDISVLVPIGIHAGTTNAYGVTWPPAASVLLGSNFQTFAAFIIASYLKVGKIIRSLTRRDVRA